MDNNLFDMEAEKRAEIVFQRVDDVATRQAWERTAVQETQDLANPFRTLIAGMLSARTREEATRSATNKLFNLAETPNEMLKLSDETIMQAISATTYPETKVPYVRGISEKLVEEYKGKVPSKLEDLMALPGIGWKTAVLTQWMVFGIADEICVDVHVARIGIRLGFVNPKSKQPEKISRELMQVVPKALWGSWNPLMVRFGREICQPIKPRCPICPLNDICPKIGV